MARDVDKAIRDVFLSVNEPDRNMEPANVVDGLFAIAKSIESLSRAVDRLGTGNAATPMGAIEYLGTRVGEAIDGIRDALTEG